MQCAFLQARLGHDGTRLTQSMDIRCAHENSKASCEFLKFLYQAQPCSADRSAQHSRSSSYGWLHTACLRSPSIMPHCWVHTLHMCPGPSGKLLALLLCHSQPHRSQPDSTLLKAFFA